MPSFTVPKDLAEQLTHCDMGRKLDAGDLGVIEVVENRLVKEGRWADDYDLVVRTEDLAVWRIRYVDDSCTRFGCNDKDPEFKQVKPVPKITIEYADVE